MCPVYYPIAMWKSKTFQNTMTRTTYKKITKEWVTPYINFKLFKGTL